VGASGLSVAYGTDVANQVGQMAEGINQPLHAVLWSGNAESAIDLHPATGYTNSGADAVSGNQEVGNGVSALDGQRHALLWTGSAASFVDLNPTGLQKSTASGTNGFQQVGVGNYSGESAIALVWTGTADSMVDLSTFMPTMLTADPTAYFTSSQAQNIDVDGNIFGLAEDGAGNLHSVEWVVTPEPSSIGVLSIGCIVTLRRGR
jgi:hypothetical protein